MAKYTITLNGHSYAEMTKAYAKKVYANFRRSWITELREAYGRCSWAKINAFEYCRNLESSCRAYNGRIVSYNTCMFTYGFTCEIDGQAWFVYITKDHDYAIKMDALQ